MTTRRSRALSLRAHHTLARLAVFVVALGAAAPLGCSRGEATATKEPAPAPLVVKDDSQGLLFTYVDETGNFHVEQSVEKVPTGAREHVRVMDPARTDPPDQIYQADLRTKKADGTYPVGLVSRASFDALASNRRTATLAKGANEDPSAKTAAAEPANKSVVVYGATWCGACAKTRSYLKSKHVPFVDKDIDADSSAAREMRVKLSKAGIQSSGIPVIDVGGKVMVGFDPGALDRALGS